MALIKRRVWASVLVTGAVAAVVGWVLIPIVLRQQTLKQLSNHDESIRLAAQLDVAARAEDDETWRTAAIDQLDDLTTPYAIELHQSLADVGHADNEALVAAVLALLESADDQTFEAWTQQLDRHGQLKTPPLTLNLYLRWVTAGAKSKSATSRILAVQRVAELRDHVLDSRLAELLDTLAGDDEYTVRYAALVAAGELAGLPVFDEMDIDVRVPYEQVIASLSKDSEPAVARDAWIMLGLLNPLYGFGGEQWKSSDASVAQAIIWTVTRTNPDRPAAAKEALLGDVVDLPVRQAAAYALYAYGNDDNANAQWKQVITDEDAAIVDVDTATVQQITPLFGDDNPWVRDVACMIAAERFDEPTLRALIHDLLWEYNYNARISGAMLAAITGIRQNYTDRFGEKPAEVNLLLHRAANQEHPTVHAMFRLALYARGDVPPDEVFARNLLAREDIPRSTLTMALLHAGQTIALDDLLNPRGNEPEPLRIMLGDFQWHRVLYRYLPKDAPPFYGWAVDDVQQLQVDVLRNWWLLNRHREWDERP